MDEISSVSFWGENALDSGFRSRTTTIQKLKAQAGDQNPSVSRSSPQR